VVHEGGIPKKSAGGEFESRKRRGTRLDVRGKKVSWCFFRKIKRGGNKHATSLKWKEEKTRPSRFSRGRKDLLVFFFE